ncbi:MAG: hypothetical protein EOO50_05200 [Flavobacterium sp.]|uniref:hypothetical protein n=1 Tax=Flavobacterium sp. TaxID=239 RepID=UPI0011F9D75C|nr:hypothetical protein [Flavobacterium sp.]RZJ67680.1 MAG: hypothetical protein EOO50_05200 [Flavobacterium sp.]
MKAKDYLEEWFANYPEEHRNRLREDFKHKFGDAWYELFIHQLFFLQGFQMEVHPEVPNSTRRPDFLATKKGYSCYVEAKVLTGLSKREEGLITIREMIEDRLQEMNLPNHLLSLDKLEFKDENVPSLRKITKWIESKVSKISVDEIKTGSDLDSREYLKFENEKILIVMRVLSSNVKSIVPEDFDDHRPIGLFPTNFEVIVGGKEAIQDAFKFKAMHYGELDKPYIMCFNLNNWKLDLHHDVNQALLNNIGSNKGFWAVNPPKYKRVSAVLFTKAQPSDWINYKHRLILNPAPNFDFHFEFLNLTFEMVRTKTDVIERKDINDIFTKK